MPNTAPFTILIRQVSKRSMHNLGATQHDPQHGADWVGQLTHFAGHLSHSVGFRAYLEVPLGANESCE